MKHHTSFGETETSYPSIGKALAIHQTRDLMAACIGAFALGRKVYGICA